MFAYCAKRNREKRGTTFSARSRLIHRKGEHFQWASYEIPDVTVQVGFEAMQVLPHPRCSLGALEGGTYQAASSTRCRNRSSLARSHMVRLIVFR